MRDYVCVHSLIVPWFFHRPCCPSSESFRQRLPRSLFGPLGPPGPCELLTKSPQYYSNNRRRDKEHIYTSGLSLKAKRHCLEDFQTSLPLKIRAPIAPHTHPDSQFLSLEKKKCTIPGMGDVGAKYTTPSPIPPANPQAPPI